MWLHTYKTHDPYAAGERYRSLFVSSQAMDGLRVESVDSGVPGKYRARLDAYDRTIREADDLVAGLVGELERLGLLERTLVVLVSDHGEAFGEHGLAGHGFQAYQEALTVPLVLRGPGVPVGRRVTTPVSLVDLVPISSASRHFPRRRASASRPRSAASHCRRIARSTSSG